jgi:transcriptional regulator GlxA family with amidase domain
MGKVLVFIYDNMADFELGVVWNILASLKKEVITIAYGQRTIKSNPGVQYCPHMTVKEALACSNVEGIILPGGWNEEHRPELTELLQKLDGENKLIAAICAGTRFLASAGIYSKHRYTTGWTIDNFDAESLKEPFPQNNYVCKRVMRDKNVITSVGSAFIDFALEIGSYFNLFSSNEERLSFAKTIKGC